MNKNYLIIVPVRAGSVRVPNKNIRPFGLDKTSLLERKLKSLSQLQKNHDNVWVVVSTDSEEAKSIADKYDIGVDPRPSELCQCSTKIEELCHHFGNIATPDQHIVWAHVTHPFLDKNFYYNAMKLYEHALTEGYDSLLTVRSDPEFLWDTKKAKPFNFPAGTWPRSQDLSNDIGIITHSTYIASSNIHKNLHNRVGLVPYAMTVTNVEAMDIDTLEDFKLAEAYEHSIR